MSIFRNATQDDLSLILSWAAEEGWNPGLDDAAAFFAADPAGFFVATTGGATVAAISVVNHSDDFAFLGLYIVRPAFRGQGIGYGLWQHALVHAQDRTVGLDGVPDQQANYAASGFVLAGQTTRYSGHPTPERQDDILFATPEDIPQMIELEAYASGVRKSDYMHTWFDGGPNRRTIVANGDPGCGFCTVRKCQNGAKIGPLVADNPDTARRLMTHAAGLFPGHTVIDVPASSAELVRVCEDFGLSPGFDTARMYRGPFSPPARTIYAVATLELG
ncbi:GNAT family N-acetyltransferase [uncultured Roseobacter sp.]|uniref:GNAT family N-acetyltransferase n=1 Tax=uncultured Roseobacter sp. TaxID=114847 RepID=UPI0026117DD7|nr:GNAT family N-acetyltransferase [uncultured Roseobacter sp.]